MAALAAAALGGGGALRGLAGKSESFVLRRRGDRAVCSGEQGDEELHELAQQRPRSEEAGSLMRVYAIGRSASPLASGGGSISIHCFVHPDPLCQGTASIGGLARKPARRYPFHFHFGGHKMRFVAKLCRELQNWKK